ncbi:UNVERIFIED_CONTAM: hypothetical protein K2H54_007770 [Gekko kuhli]
MLTSKMKGRMGMNVRVFSDNRVRARMQCMRKGKGLHLHYIGGQAKLTDKLKRRENRHPSEFLAEARIEPGTFWTTAYYASQLAVKGQQLQLFVLRFSINW